MNLQTHIRSELWAAIQDTYEADNYSPSILDAIHLYSDVIREKTGLDGDGSALVGQAFGGDDPRLRLNRLQTETERNIQKGAEQLSRGLYLAIRNPRSHEQIQDSKQTADSIIYFIDHLLSLIAESIEPFTIDSFIERVFDPDFVHSDRYADLLASEIPANKKLDTTIEIYRRREEGTGRNLAYMFNGLLNSLSEEDLTFFLSVVADDLKVQQDKRLIRISLQILQPSLWQNLTEVARLRIENMLLQSIEEGRMDPGLKRTSSGAFGTWARKYLQYFELKEKFGQALLEKLESSSRYERMYTVSFFLSEVHNSVGTPYQKKRCINAISEIVRNDYETSIDYFTSAFHRYPEDWQDEFVKKLEDLTDPENPAIYLPDGTAFLKDVSTDDLQYDEDEIPF